VTGGVPHRCGAVLWGLPGLPRQFTPKLHSSSDTRLVRAVVVHHPDLAIDAADERDPAPFWEPRGIGAAGGAVAFRPVSP
jgi:hypothetical protein